MEVDGDEDGGPGRRQRPKAARSVPKGGGGGGAAQALRRARSVPVSGVLRTPGGPGGAVRAASPTAKRTRALPAVDERGGASEGATPEPGGGSPDTPPSSDSSSEGAETPGGRLLARLGSKIIRGSPERMRAAKNRAAASPDATTAATPPLSPKQQHSPAGDAPRDIGTKTQRPRRSALARHASAPSQGGSAAAAGSKRGREPPRTKSNLRVQFASQDEVIEFVPTQDEPAVEEARPVRAGRAREEPHVGAPASADEMSSRGHVEEMMGDLGFAMAGIDGAGTPAAQARSAARVVSLCATRQGCFAAARAGLLSQVLAKLSAALARRPSPALRTYAALALLACSKEGIDPAVLASDAALSILLATLRWADADADGPDAPVTNDDEVRPLLGRSSLGRGAMLAIGSLPKSAASGEAESAPPCSPAAAQRAALVAYGSVLSPTFASASASAAAATRAERSGRALREALPQSGCLAAAVALTHSELAATLEGLAASGSCQLGSAPGRLGLVESGLTLIEHAVFLAETGRTAVLSAAPTACTITCDAAAAPLPFVVRRPVPRASSADDDAPPTFPALLTTAVAWLTSAIERDERHVAAARRTVFAALHVLTNLTNGHEGACSAVAAHGGVETLLACLCASCVDAGREGGSPAQWRFCAGRIEEISYHLALLINIVAEDARTCASVATMEVFRREEGRADKRGSAGRVSSPSRRSSRGGSDAGLPTWLTQAGGGTPGDAGGAREEQERVCTAVEMLGWLLARASELDAGSSAHGDGGRGRVRAGQADEVTVDDVDDRHAQANAGMVAGYAALLLGLVVSGNAEAQEAAATMLPGGSLRPMVVHVAEMLAFYRKAGAITEETEERMRAVVREGRRYELQAGRQI
ncbi:unnamed protein product [Pedinophyceae sp. YPF-701]|nr:unnamed protein product [Pedinophyceae sp. YPF-701]